MFFSYISRRNMRSYVRRSAVGILCAFVAYFAYMKTWEQGIQSLEQNAESRIAIFSSKLFSPSEMYNYLPELVGQYVKIQEALLRQSDASVIGRANEHLAYLNAKAGSNLIYVLNLDGTTIAASNWDAQDSLVGKNYAFRPYFKEALNNGSGTFYAMGVTTSVPGYYLSHLVKKNGVPLGIVVVKVNLSDVGMRRDSNEHEMIVTDEHGVIFLSSREDWKYRPIRKLPPSEKERLGKTRQYEGVLGDVLPIRQRESIKDDEQLISITNKKRWYWDEEHAYFVKSRSLPNKEWTVHILTSTQKIERHAQQAASMAAGGVVLIAFLFMYLHQLRIHARERKEAELVLRQSHEALSQAHAELSQAHSSLEKRNSELEALSEELRIKSITDPLTGLFNRRFFMETASKLVSAANRHNQPFSVVMVDVDHFKQINDVRGHQAGDEVLQTLAKLFREEMRDSDVLARYGGEEFIIVLPHTDTLGAQTVAERIRVKVMHHPVNLGNDSILTTISVGVSESRPNESSIDKVIQRADKALYEAKKGGRNKVVINDQCAGAVLLKEEN